MAIDGLNRDKRSVGWLGMVAACALGLRLWSIDFGLPFAYHVDEANYSVAVQDVHRSGLNAIDPSFNLLQALSLGAHVLLERLRPLVAAFPLSEPVRAAMWSEPEVFIVLARLISGVVGALTVIPVFLLGRTLWGDFAGLTGALLLAVNFLHVRNSHFGTPEVLATFCAAVAGYACAVVSTRSSWRHSVVAGGFAGLAVGAKFLMWPVLLALPLCHFAGRGRVRASRDAAMWTAVAVAVAAVVVCTPQLVVKPDVVWSYWGSLRTVGARGGMDRIQLASSGASLAYLETLWWGMGGVGLAFALAGLGAAAVRRFGTSAMLATCLSLVYFGFLILPGQTFFARYALGVLPVMTLAASWVMRSAFDRLQAVRFGPVLAALGVVVLLAEPLAASVRFNLLLSRPDTRTLAMRWIEQTIPSGSTVMLEFWWFGPQLASPERRVPTSTREYRVMTRGTYGLSEVSNYFGPSQGTPSVADYEAAGAEYLVTTSFMSGMRLLDAAEDRAKRGFYTSLDREADLVRVFTPFADGREATGVFDEVYGPAANVWRMTRPGPVVKIYRLRAKRAA